MAGTQRRTGRRGRRRGAAILEFTLSFLAFLITLAALAELGRAVWTFTTLRHAIFEGARFATVHGSENPVIQNGQDDTMSAIEDVVKHNAIGLMPDQIQIQTSYSPDNSPGSEFVVSATYSMPTMVGRLFFSTGDFAIRTQAAGVVLQ